MADGKLFFLAESGVLDILRASSGSYQELSHHQILNGKCWTVPTIDGKRLYARSAEGDLVCYQLGGGALTVDPQPPDKDVNLNY